MSRDATGTVGIATQIATPGATGSPGGVGGSGASGGGGTKGNISLTSVANVAKNRFWETLEKNIRDLLRETDKILPAGTQSPEEQAAEAELNEAERQSEERKAEAAHQDISPDFQTLTEDQADIQLEDDDAAV